jgi:penicillin-binding protein 2
MQTAERVGSRSLAKMARRFGVGQSTDIDGIFSDAAGHLPDPAHTRRNARNSWQAGDTLQMGIVQATVTITPLQGACIAAAIANGGKVVHPRLIRQVGEKQRAVIEPTPIGLKDATIRAIDRGLRAVVGEGTAQSLDPSLHNPAQEYDNNCVRHQSSHLEFGNSRPKR